MHGARHYSADPGNQPHAITHGDDAGRSSDYIHNVPDAGSGADGIPVRIEGANGNRNASP